MSNRSTVENAGTNRSEEVTGHRTDVAPTPMHI